MPSKKPKAMARSSDSHEQEFTTRTGEEPSSQGAGEGHWQWHSLENSAGCWAEDSERSMECPGATEGADHQVSAEKAKAQAANDCVKAIEDNQTPKMTRAGN